MDYLRVVRLEETDATGVIFFSKLQSIGLECIEIFLNSSGYTVPILQKNGYLFPIIAAEAHYFSPIRCADVLMIRLSFRSIGRSSVTFFLQFFLNQELAADLEIKQVFIDAVSFKSIPILSSLREKVESLPKIEVE